MKPNRLPILIAAVGVLLRCIPSFRYTWYDENFSILLARLPLDRLLAATAGDVHPPLWYLLCWPLGQIHGLPGWAVVRLPALICSLAAIPVFWKILKSTYLSDRARLVAFGLFCVLPTQIYYAQEGRQYALLVLLVLSAWLAIRRCNWFLLGITTALMLWLHNYGLIYAATLWLAGLALNHRQWKPLTLSIAAGGLTFLPWAFVLASQMSAIDGNYWMVRVSLTSVLMEFAEGVWGTGTLPIQMVVVFLFYGLLTWVLLWSLRTQTMKPSIVILALAPPLLAAAVSVLWQPVMLSRALVPAGAFVCILFAAPVDWLAEKPRRLILANLFFAPLLVICLLTSYTRPVWAQRSTTNTRAAIALIDRNWQAGDLLYHTDDGIYVTLTALDTRIDNVMRLEPCGVVRGSLTPQTRLAIGERIGPLSLHNSGRVWVVTAETPLNDQCEINAMRQMGLLKTQPLYCLANDQLVKACVYLVTP
jgi:hypothetical protein